MNDKSKDLLKKMCFILKIVRWVCLISVVLLIGLSLFYAFNKDIYNTLFGSIRIDYLQLIFNDDLALNKDNMYFKQIINFDLLFNTKYVTQINFGIRLHLSFLVFAALIYLLSYIFRYGQELQQLSDETL